VAPGLLGPSLNEWVNGMKNARNGEGHQLYAAPEFGADKFDPYYQLLTSGLWVARISLLLLMDVEAATLTAALHSHQSFLFDLANMDTCTNGCAGSLERRSDILDGAGTSSLPRTPRLSGIESPTPRVLSIGGPPKESTKSPHERENHPHSQARDSSRAAPFDPIRTLP
jgi:hypothetical protein